MRIVTDGAVDVPENLNGSERLVQVPGDVFDDDGALLLTPAQFWAQLRRGSYPSTSPPTVAALLEAYHQREPVLALHVSAQLSATISRAKEAAVRAEVEVTIVDTGSLSVGSGLVVAAVHRAAQDAGDSAAVLDLARALPGRLHTFAVIQDVEALRSSDRSGLIPESHLARNHPLVLAVRGRVVALAQPRNRRSAIEDLGKHLRHTAPVAGAWALGHGDAADIEVVTAELTKVLGSAPAFVSQLDPTIGVHLGPDALVVGAISGPVTL
jgi:DegV family protein with EDD domain